MIKFKNSYIPPAKVLSFDIECRPLSWISSDYVSKEITAIACKFVGEKKAHSWLLGEDDPVLMLEEFRTFYDSATMVTGHYIRAYDLPTINACMSELELQPLSDKLSHDTKLDLVKRSGISNSQESLGAMLGLDHQKISMNQSKWREANRLTPEGLMLTKERVVGDVEQHIEMREKMMKLNMLGPPKVWYSRSEFSGGGYTP